MKRNTGTRSPKAKKESQQVRLAAMMKRMQSPSQRRGVDKFFAMTPEELGAAALQAVGSQKKSKGLPRTEPSPRSPLPLKELKFLKSIFGAATKHVLRLAVLDEDALEKLMSTKSGARALARLVPKPKGARSIGFPPWGSSEIADPTPYTEAEYRRYLRGLNPRANRPLKRQPGKSK